MSGVELLKESGTIKKFRKDDIIFTEGEPGSELFIVLSGRVGVYINSFNGLPLKLTDIGPGSFFGEMSVLDDQPRSATVAALEDTTVLAVNKTNFQSFTSNRPEIAYKIMKGLCTRIRGLNEELGKLRAGAAPERKATRDTIQSLKTDSKEIRQVIHGIYPEGHKSYDLVAPDTHEAFLSGKQLTCPLCRETFNVKVPRLSKLRLEKVENDFRKKFIDFEPLWYNIWVCPKCLYSSFHTDFENLRDQAVKPVKETLERIRGSLGYVKETSSDINSVFTAYYLAIGCSTAYRPESLKVARLWMQLGWLYKDVNDEEMHKKACASALECYLDAFYNSKTNLSIEQEQQCSIIIGELYLVKGDKSEALKHFQQAIIRKNGVSSLNQQAQDRIYEIRKSEVT